MSAHVEAPYIGLPDGNWVDITIRSEPRTQMEFPIVGTFPPRHTGMLPERAYVVANDRTGIIGRALGIQPIDGSKTQTHQPEWEIPLGFIAHLIR